MSEFVSFLNDLRRYKIITKRQVFLAWLKSPQIRFLIVFRKAVEYKKYSLMGLFFRILYRHYSLQTGYQIPIGTKIGKGLYLGHLGAIVINPRAVLGENCI